MDSFTATRRAKSLNGGDCAFVADPRRTALDQPVFWNQIADPGAILLHRVSFASSDTGTAEEFIRVHTVDSSGDGCLRLSVNEERLEVTRVDSDSGGVLVAIIILDNDAPDRLHALTRFSAMLTGQRVPTDNRLTPQRRRRTRQMLRVFDARSAGATYRDIAIVIYGRSRVASEPWKTSSLRDAVIGLVEAGFTMVDGGYLQLLRRRRRS
ncbi:DUF2285 domain-containing protein [Agrobacterium tumefaciens]|uniref:DUF2285 domain-containing protein n=1 Tax=Agrobacterium tumefaciens TaxID=358 RepID=UPI001B8A0179